MSTGEHNLGKLPILQIITKKTGQLVCWISNPFITSISSECLLKYHENTKYLIAFALNVSKLRVKCKYFGRFHLILHARKIPTHKNTNSPRSAIYRTKCQCMNTSLRHKFKIPLFLAKIIRQKSIVPVTNTDLQKMQTTENYVH